MSWRLASSDARRHSERPGIYRVPGAGVVEGACPSVGGTAGVVGAGGLAGAWAVGVAGAGVDRPGVFTGRGRCAGRKTPDPQHADALVCVDLSVIRKCQLDRLRGLELVCNTNVRCGPVAPPFSGAETMLIVAADALPQPSWR